MRNLLSAGENITPCLERYERETLSNFEVAFGSVKLGSQVQIPGQVNSEQ